MLCSATVSFALTADAALPKIQSVVVTPSYVGTSPNADPSLNVSWTAVGDPAVSYVVRYSTSRGTVAAPPDGAAQMSANRNSVTLSDNLAPDKRRSYTYYIWVATMSAGVPMGEYSDRTSGRTLNSKLKLGLMNVFPDSDVTVAIFMQVSCAEVLLPVHGMFLF